MLSETGWSAKPLPDRPVIFALIASECMPVSVPMPLTAELHVREGVAGYCIAGFPGTLRIGGGSKTGMYVP
ncbi:hypothetical protein CYD94_20850 (plasmid) [Ralstonia solanacearum]|uniref:Uncharacterized protein n=2 Tax=Ralstonia solanacearum species complex TaxID=3116862 RepID=A0A454TQH9_9RALS|nr:hypothetical protein CYD94_20850 [Ralstonia solanacearum]AYA48691.1 hypothetical protein RSP824_19800 [Ralstonia pseudosolanacearum]RAA11818.1 hypothetical protein DOT67_12775 [Ralstonia pseudosolanacearum]RAA17692.1 hypothetical protein DOT79_08845 [Ralstonia pseudosolanacearum]RNM05656.1 hypothetical protein EGA29_14075 [Ralstonia pseudosolanacearum]